MMTERTARTVLEMALDDGQWWTRQSEMWLNTQAWEREWLPQADGSVPRCQRGIRRGAVLALSAAILILALEA